jgi:DNA-directed RNA polymerase subunit beta
MNARLDLKTDDQLRVLRKEDILAILKYLHELKDGRGRSR